MRSNWRRKRVLSDKLRKGEMTKTVRLRISASEWDAIQKVADRLPRASNGGRRYAAAVAILVRSALDGLSENTTDDSNT